MSTFIASASVEASPSTYKGDRYLKEAKESLEAALRIIEHSTTNITLSEVKTAANIAQQAATTLSQLVGALKPRNDLPD